ncbi:MAG: hypothetical protein U0174_12215 [Polyangiaceae bacterium]
MKMTPSYVLAKVALLLSLGLFGCAPAAAPAAPAAPPPTPHAVAPAPSSLPAAKLADPPPTQASAHTLPFELDADGRASFVFMVNGAGVADDQALESGTIALVRYGSSMRVTGKGLAFAFRMQVPNPEQALSIYDLRTYVTQAASDTHPRFAWAKGKMRATTYVANASLYAGRLEGSLPVAEHLHESSWELLCAVRAKGTFTLEGVSQRLEDGACVNVPPGHKHAWQPDAGSELDAIQVYTPPGPEARFRKLAETAP